MVALVAFSACGYAQDSRQIWEHSDGMFKDQGDGVWVETDRNGAILHKFLEVDRTSEFVQLYDSESVSKPWSLVSRFLRGGRRGLPLPPHCLHRTRNSSDDASVVYESLLVRSFR